MKKNLLIILVLLCLTGCAAPVSAPVGGDETLTVICTVFPPYDFVREIGGEFAAVSMLLKPGQDSHSYEPTGKDIAALQRCDLFIYTGGQNDAWADEILAALDTPPRTLKMLDYASEAAPGIARPSDEVRRFDTAQISTVRQTFALDRLSGSGQLPAAAHLSRAAALSEGHNHNEDYEHAPADEHVWTSPEQARRIVSAIAAALSDLDPDHADLYRRNALAYDEKLAALSAQLAQTIAGGVRHEIVVGDPFPFYYLARDYGLEYHAAFPSCGGEAEPSAQTMIALSDKVKTEGIPVVFYIEFSSRQVADALVEGSGAETALLHSCHNLSSEELARGETYLSLMARNTENLRRALG